MSDAHPCVNCHGPAELRARLGDSHLELWVCASCYGFGASIREAEERGARWMREACVAEERSHHYNCSRYECCGEWLENKPVLDPAEVCKKARDADARIRKNEERDA